MVPRAKHAIARIKPRRRDRRKKSQQGAQAPPRTDRAAAHAIEPANTIARIAGDKQSRTRAATKCSQGITTQRVTILFFLRSATQRAVPTRAGGECFLSGRVYTASQQALRFSLDAVLESTPPTPQHHWSHCQCAERMEKEHRRQPHLADTTTLLIYAAPTHASPKPTLCL